jgi:hypothetical protein
MTSGALTDTQRAFNLIREAVEETRAATPDDPRGRAHSQGVTAGLEMALDRLQAIDPDADAGWYSVPGRVYGPEEPREFTHGGVLDAIHMDGFGDPDAPGPRWINADADYPGPPSDI